MRLFPSGFMCTPRGTVGDLHIYNTDAHRNYVGYRFDGSATAIELKNCRGVREPDVRVDGQHGGGDLFVLSLLRQQSCDRGLDRCDGYAGADRRGHNLAVDTPPHVRGFMRYPARITVTYDDPGLIDGSHQFIQSLLPTFQAKHVPLEHRRGHGL